jgi:hypothetical protein
LVSLLIIAIVALAGCARYDGNPARYDHNGAYDHNGNLRGNYTTDYNNNNRVNDGVLNNNRLDNNRLDHNRNHHPDNNLNSTHRNGLTDGSVINNR